MLETKEIPFTKKSGRPVLLSGNAVFDLLNDTCFASKWNALLEQCRWKTPFQTLPFVHTWYHVYRKCITPIIIKAEFDNRLTGILTLASHPDKVITGAGANQAEYVTWITANPNDESFIEQSLIELLKKFPGHKVSLKYIPKQVPMNFAAKPEWQSRCHIIEYLQPLMVLNEKRIDNELSKKKRKEKIRRLQKIGPLNFERIVDVDKFAFILDELTCQFDLRKGALYNKLPFQSDPYRKTFLVELFRQDLLHATVLKLNEKIIASNVGIQSDTWLHLQGLNTHHPAYARHSPGIIHFLLLGKLLVKEGFEVFDLTPGGDSYKETLATDYTTSYHLSVGGKFYGTGLRLKLKAKKLIGGAVSHLLKATNRNTANPAAPVKTVTSSESNVNGVHSAKNKDYQVITTNSIRTPEFRIEQNSLKDLLLYKSHGGSCGRKFFLQDAMLRMQQGEHFFSWTDNSTLMACAWYADASQHQSDNLEPDNSERAPALDITITHVYYHRTAADRLAQFVQSLINHVQSSGNSTISIKKNCRSVFTAAGYETRAHS